MQVIHRTIIFTETVMFLIIWLAFLGGTLSVILPETRSFSGNTENAYDVAVNNSIEYIIYYTNSTVSMSLFQSW